MTPEGTAPGEEMNESRIQISVTGIASFVKICSKRHKAN
jgi:hypothetical protein